MSFDKLNKLASSVNSIMSEGEKLSLHVLAARARKALQEFPEDTTIRSMAQILSRMSDNRPFISRAELKSVYNKLYVRNTRFPEIFASELGGETQLQGPKMYERSGEEISSESLQEFADPVLANALASAFDKNQPLKLYSEKAALAAVRKVASTFNSVAGLDCRTNVVAGNSEFIIVQANFETPKGQTNVFVPVEVLENSQVLEPSVFVSNRGSEELAGETITEYVQSFAGKELQLRAQDLLALVDRIKNGTKEISAVELALTKFNATKQAQTEYFANSVTGLTMDSEAAKDVQLPQVSDPEIQSFAEKFDSPFGRANFAHGDRKVHAGRKSIEMALRGLNPVQIAVAGCDDNQVVYAVSVGKTAFTVPVKMATDTPSAEVFICNGHVRELNRSNVEALLVRSEKDYKAAAVASPLYSNKPSELLETVRSAMAEGNLPKAEDALNVLASAGDEKAYNAGLAAYMQGLNKKAAPAAEACKCNRIIRNAHSKHPICGHTGLPLHKVYQDDNGDCLPLYRKGMSESYEGAAFMTNKIFF